VTRQASNASIIDTEQVVKLGKEANSKESGHCDAQYLVGLGYFTSHGLSTEMSRRETGTVGSG
jgi:hypothetical protein